MPRLRRYILVVDDDKALLRLLYERFQADYIVLRATHGKNAILLARAFVPILIILDVEMPDMNGYNILYRLRTDSRTSNIPVIFYANNGDLLHHLDRYRVLEAQFGIVLNVPQSEGIAALERVMHDALTSTTNAAARSAAYPRYDHIRQMLYLEERQIALHTKEGQLWDALAQCPNHMFLYTELTYLYDAIYNWDMAAIAGRLQWMAKKINEKLAMLPNCPCSITIEPSGLTLKVSR